MSRNVNPPEQPLSYADVYEAPQEQPGEPRSAPTAFTAAELAAMTFPPPRWAVDGILASGLNLLAGAPKVGKSWLALGLAVAVASGGRAFGSIHCQQGDVVYLALEDSLRRLQKRLAMVLDGAQAPDRLLMSVKAEPMPEGAKQLDRWLEKHPQARLVVVDVLAKVRPSGGAHQSRYDADYAVLAPLHELAHKRDVAILVVHHTRKARSDDFVDAVSGTAGLAGAADAVLTLTRARNTAGAILSVTGRDVEESEKALDFHKATGTWRLLEGPASDYQVSEERRSILQLLRSSEAPLTPKQISDGTGIGHDVARHLLVKMRDSGDVESAGNGRYLAVHSVHSVHSQAESLALPMGSGGDQL